MKTAKRILVLSTYPIAGANSGGQLRVKAIVDAYREAFTEVKHVGIYARDNYPYHFAADDIRIGGELGAKILADGMMADVRVPEAIVADADLRAQVRELLVSFRPDVVAFEQPYLYLGLHGLLNELPVRPQIVHSSQNVEHLLKPEIMRGLGYSEPIVEAMAGLVREVETELCATAAVTAVVGPADAAVLAELGASRVVLAPNGVSRKETDREDVLAWEHELRTRGISSYALFVGSAHPPNLSGFRTMVTTALGYVPRGSAIVVAGGVGDMLQRSLRGDSLADVTAHRRLVVAGRVSDARLQSMLARAAAVLLPITEGGGSNLKTAKAVISGRPIVGTSIAFRAFEELMSLPGVTIADDPAAFRAAVARALVAPSLGLERPAVAESVLWENCLSDLVEAVRAL